MNESSPAPNAARSVTFSSMLVGADSRPCVLRL
jgi:hypothetical protein